MTENLELPSWLLGFGLGKSGAETTINGCVADCQVRLTSQSWYWRSPQAWSTITHATMVYVTNEDDDSIRTTTVYNDLPEGVTLPATNAAGTQTTQVTVETARGEFATLDIAYPTEIGREPIDYAWKGVLPTLDAMGNFICSTATLAAFDLANRNASLTTTSLPVDPSDQGGINYYLETTRYPGVIAPRPSGDEFNAEDGAFLHCNDPPPLCPFAGKMTSVRFLTETSHSRERSIMKTGATRTPAPTPLVAAQEAVAGPAPVVGQGPEPTGGAKSKAVLGTATDVHLHQPGGQLPVSSGGAQQTQSNQVKPDRGDAGHPGVDGIVVEGAATVGGSTSKPGAVGGSLSKLGTGGLTTDGATVSASGANNATSVRLEQFQGAAMSLTSSLWLLLSFCLLVLNL